MAGIQAVNRAWPPALTFAWSRECGAGWVLRAQVAAAMVVDSDFSFGVPTAGLQKKQCQSVSEMPYTDSGICIVTFKDNSWE